MNNKSQKILFIQFWRISSMFMIFVMLVSVVGVKRVSAAPAATWPPGWADNTSITDTAAGDPIVYVVSGIDTEAFDGHPMESLHVAFDLRNYFPETTVYIGPIMDSTYRNSHTDSFGDPFKMTWFMEMDNFINNGVYPDGSPMNYLTLYDTFVNNYGTELDAWGDELAYHHHFMYWNGSVWIASGQQHAIDGQYDEHNNALDHMILDANFFPTNFRAGWLSNDNQLQAWLEKWMLADYGSFWSSSWIPYHPSSTDYTQVGDMNHWIALCESAPGSVNINAAFDEALSTGQPVIYCWYGHDNENMNNYIDWMQYNLDSASTRTGVPFKFTTSKEAMQAIMGTDDTTPPTLTVTHGSGDTFNITSNEPLWNNAPYVAARYGEGTSAVYQHVTAASAGTNAWTVNLPSMNGSLELQQVGAGALDLFGNSAVANYDINASITYIISGNAGVADATLTYTGGSATANSNGDYSFSVEHGWSGTVTPSRTGYTFTPDSKPYTDVTTDMSGEDYTATLNPIVNTFPTTSGISNVNVLEDATTTVFSLYPSFADAEDTDAQLTYTVTGNTNAALFTSVDISDPTNFTLDYAPNANGTANITVRATDTGTLFVETTFAVTVTAVNDEPSFTSSGNVGVRENSGAYSAGWATGISAGPADEAGQTLNFVIDSNSNPGLFATGPAIASNGTLSFTPAANTTGVATLDVHLEDNGGVANGGDDTSPTQSFNILVGIVNGPPVNTVPGAQTVDQGVPLVFSAGNANQISVSDPDTGTSPIQVTLNVTAGSLTLNGTAGLSFTVGDGMGDASMTFTGSLANINAALNGMAYTSVALGADTLTIMANDQGNTGVGGAQTDTDTVGITVNGAPPQVINNGVNSVPDTGDGILSEGETATVGITQLLVIFNQPMDETTAGDEVTNAANYLLLSEGAVAGFQTASCAVVKTGAGVDPDDTQIAITSVTYNSSTFTATLNLASALPDGIYRLYACGTATLRDLAGNALGGGVDFIRNFQVQLPVAGGGGGGGGGAGGGGNAATTSSAGQIPVTGFAPGRITDLSGLPITSYHASNGVTLEVPALKLKLPIVGVPMQNKSWDVNWLLNQAGWLEGTAFPGYSGNSVLTSHVTLSYGQAGPFANLHKLRAGDKIFVHAFGDLYIYEVKSVKKLDATDSSILRHEDKSWLTLVTCADYNEKAETYLKRLVVKAVLVQTQPDS